MELFTPEQLQDIDARRSTFLVEYKKLRDTHEVDFLAHPTFVPNEHGTFEVRIQVEAVDLKYAPQPSPFHNV